MARNPHVVEAPIGGRSKLGRLYLRALHLAMDVAPLGTAEETDCRLAAFDQALEDLGLEMVKAATRAGWRRP